MAAAQEGGLGADLSAIVVVWHRELLRFRRNRLRMVTSLVQPLLFLFILGSGLSSMLPSSNGVNFKTFMFPGIIAMTVFFTALSSALSIVWDREFGFMREMLVAPARRGAIVIGKCAGGATVATLQGVVILSLAGVVNIPYAPSLLVTLVAEMVLMAVSLTALGLLLASRMTQVESFMAVMNFVRLHSYQIRSADVCSRSGAARRVCARPCERRGQADHERGRQVGKLDAPGRRRARDDRGHGGAHAHPRDPAVRRTE